MAFKLGGSGAKMKQVAQKEQALRKKMQTAETMSAAKVPANLSSAIAQIKLNCQKYLSKYEDKYLLLRDEDSVRQYFDEIIKSGIAAIDTETTGLNPMLVKLAGLCLYVPGHKPCYIPVNHVGHVTRARLDGQLSEEFLKQQLERCTDVKWIMHNAKYDIRVLRHTCNVDLTCYWDTMLAAKMLNENESSALKNLHMKYCPSEDSKALTISTLFDGMMFTLIPIECAYLYAAGDAVKTYELYTFQKFHLDKPHLAGPRHVFKTIEMPMIRILADMEDRGVALDFEFAKYLHDKYSAKLKEAEKACYAALEPEKGKIDDYRLTVRDCKLSDPINLSSTVQVGILLYDILNLKPKNGQNFGKKVGEEQLLQLDHPFVKNLLEYRGLIKLMSTYVDKLPAVVDPNTKRIHPSFNAMGAKTGRMSSADPENANRDHKIRLIQGRAAA